MIKGRYRLVFEEQRTAHKEQLLKKLSRILISK